MNERQAKLSVHERNSEFMNEMNIHAEVHDVHRCMCYIWHTRVADSESERAKSQNFLEGKIDEVKFAVFYSSKHHRQGVPAVSGL